MIKCNVVPSHSRDDALECFAVNHSFRQDCRSVGFGSETTMSLRSECQIGLCDACFYFDAVPAVMIALCCGRERACFQVERQVFSRTFEWEERVGLCTTELVIFEVAMECHGARFRTSDHSTVSLEPLKETLFNSDQVQLPNDTRGVHGRPSRRRHEA